MNLKAVSCLFQILVGLLYVRTLSGCPTGRCGPLNSDVVCKKQDEWRCQPQGIPNNCKYTQNCCPTNCNGTACYNPVVWGCPAVPVNKKACPSPPRPDKCLSDADCSGSAKCCMRECNRLKCVTSKPKKGKCFDYSGIYCICPGTLSCGVDNDCPGTQKCCIGGCGGSFCSDIACLKKGRRDCGCRPSDQCGLPQTRECEKRNKKCPKNEVCCCPHTFWKKRLCMAK